MRRFLLASLVIPAVLLGGVQESSAQPFDTGVTTTDSAGSNDQLALNRLKRAGGSSVRVLIYWSSVAPANEPNRWDPTDPGDPHYNWAAFDQNIENAVSAGIKPLVMIYAAPKWAERCKGASAGICNPDPVEFAQFSKAAARRYSGDFGGLPRVRLWEPLNEPNLSLFFEPQVKNGKKISPRLYKNILNRFSSAVKSVHSTNKVIAGGLAPLKRPGSIAPLVFMREVLCLKGRSKPKPIKGCDTAARFDIWANNPYTTGGPNHHAIGRDDVSLGDLPEVKRLLVAAKRAGNIRTKARSVPFWVTEFSWDSAPPDPGGVPMKTLARWVPEAMFQAWDAGVGNFYWLSLRDWDRGKDLPFNVTFESGLYFRGATIEQDRPKRILKAFRFPSVAFRARDGIRVWGRTPDSDSGKVKIEFKLGSDWRKLGNVRADGDGIYHKEFRTRLGRGYRGLVRARYNGNEAIPFSLKRTKDYYQPPFG